jgi:hypothetical protein
MAELLLLLLTRIWVIRVTVEPSLEVVGGLFGKLSSFTLRTINEGGARDGLWGTRRRIGDSDGWGSRRHCRGV